MNTYAIDLLLDMLAKADERRLLLESVRKELVQLLRAKNIENTSALVDEAIDYTLDNWLVDKIIDYPEDDDYSSGSFKWFLRLLDKDESERFRNLCEIEQTFLKILHNSEYEGRLGVISADDALEKLRGLGFEPKFVPHIPDKTGVSFGTKNGQQVKYHYLLPEYERTEEFKKGLRELDERQRKKLDFLEKLEFEEYDE